MNTKRLVWILVGIVLISFGIGLYSLIYNDGINLSWIKNRGFSIRTHKSNLNMGDGKIDIKDGDSHIVLGWDGINVKDGENPGFTILKRGNWFNNLWKQTRFYTWGCNI